MDSTRASIRISHSCVALLALLLIPAVGSAQVRTKKPDRGVYQPPRLKQWSPPVSNRTSTPTRKRELAELVRSQVPSKQTRDSGVHRVDPVDVDDKPLQPRGGPLVDAELIDARQRTDADETTDEEPQRTRGSEPSEAERQPKLRRVGHEDVILMEPHRRTVIGEEVIVDGGEVWIEEPGTWTEQGAHVGCDGCTSGGCDSLGCDSCCGGDPGWWQDWSNGSICMTPDRWFGSAEVLLMWRRADTLPPLVTSGPDDDSDTAGELGQLGTEVLVGNDPILRGMTAGGRFMLGTWLDDHECRSLTLRGWVAFDETYGFFTDQDQFPVIARPFLNVSDDQAAEQDALLVAFPDRATGSISVLADSQVFGGDIAVREFWYGEYGATVDLLYGYQYMRMNTGLRISSTSTSLDDDFAPVDAVISVADSFDIANEFHGGQFGLVSRYREGCWSFNGMVKVGFGSLRREATRNGSTLTSLDDADALDPNGLLVRSTNRGKTTDNTFGWVPELDLSLGWQVFPRFDVTCGYHLIAMTDALQASGAIDQSLSVNLSDPPEGQQSPSPGLRYDTFYIQGIHFGMEYIY